MVGLRPEVCNSLPFFSAVVSKRIASKGRAAVRREGMATKWTCARTLTPGAFAPDSIFLHTGLYFFCLPLNFG